MQQIMIGRIGVTVDKGVHRILVDRLWPRGVSKAGAPWDTWLKEVAPSADLRKWYGHDPGRYTEFRQRYWRELDEQCEGRSVRQLLRIWAEHPVMLVTATKNLEASQAPVLRDYLLSRAI